VPDGAPVSEAWAGAAPVLAMVRFEVPEDAGAAFAAGAERALAALAAAPGYRAGRLARAVDEPGHWALVTEWAGPGAWRRALGGFEARQALAPLLGWAVDAPGAFEVLLGQDSPTAPPTRYGSARAADAATAAPGH
jgi:hypothetical protein